MEISQNFVAFSEYMNFKQTVNLFDSKLLSNAKTMREIALIFVAFSEYMNFTCEHSTKYSHMFFSSSYR